MAENQAQDKERAIIFKLVRASSLPSVWSVRLLNVATF